MCLAIPGKIVEIKGDNAILNYDGLKKEANVSLIDCKVGDYALVHAGFAIEIVEERRARDMYNLLYEADEKNE